MKTIASCILVLTLLIARNSFAADNSKTIERCETLASEIMDYQDEPSIEDASANAAQEKEMETLQCNEHGDFFN